MIIGILPKVNITNLNRDANSAKRAYSGTLRLTVSRAKKQKKSGGKGSVATLKNSKQLGCVVQEKEPAKSQSILQKSTKFLGSKRSVHFSKGTLHHVKIGKERVHRKELFRSVNLMSVVFMLQNSRLRPQRGMGNGGRCPEAQPSEVWSLPASFLTKSEEREFVVDSGTMRTVRKDLISAELDI